MEFKVFLIKDHKIPNKKLSVTLSEELTAYALVDNFHCFKLLNDHRIDEKGIENNNNEIIDSQKFLRKNNGKRLVSIGFVLINFKNGNVYSSNYSNKKLDNLLIKMFKIKESFARVDINKLEKIKEIQMKLTNSNQMSLFHDYISSDDSSLKKELEMQDAAIESIIAKFTFEKPSIFNKGKLKSFLKKHEAVYISGYDKEDNILRVKENVQLSIKIDLNYCSFDDIDNIDFKTLVNKISEKEEMSLNEYQNNA